MPPIPGFGNAINVQIGDRDRFRQRYGRSTVPYSSGVTLTLDYHGAGGTPGSYVLTDINSGFAVAGAGFITGTDLATGLKATSNT